MEDSYPMAIGMYRKGMGFTSHAIFLLADNLFTYQKTWPEGGGLAVEKVKGTWKEENENIIFTGQGTKTVEDRGGPMYPATDITLNDTIPKSSFKFGSFLASPWDYQPDTVPSDDTPTVPETNHRTDSVTPTTATDDRSTNSSSCSCSIL